MKKINVLTGLILVSVIIILYLATILPDSVPIHINVNGEIDRYGSKWFVLLGPAIALIAVTFVQVYLRKTQNKSLEALQIMMAILLVIILSICWLPYIIATGIGLENITIIIGVFLGGICIFTGNYMGLLKTNAVVGIRVKWTLADEEIWQKTHRLAGYITVVGGLLILIATFMELLLHTKLLIIVILAIILTAVLIAVVYSYMLYQQKYKL